MTKLPWKNKLFVYVLSLLAVIFLRYCVNVSGENLGYTNSILCIGLFLLLSYCYNKLINSAEWQEISLYLNKTIGIAICFVGALVCGVQLDNVGRVDFADWSIYLATVVVSVAITPFMAYGFVRLKGYDAKNIETKVNAKYFIGIWMLLCLSYVITLLATWPGFFTYDAEMETSMVFTEQYTAHHPILHVLMLGWALRIMYHLFQSYNAGIIAYLVVQIMVVSACFSYMMCFLKRIGVRRWIRNVGLVFLALFPTVTMFVCCTTKDVYFTAGTVLFTTLLLDMSRDSDSFWKSKKKICLVIMASLMLMFFRNNGFYAYIVLAFFFVPVCKKYWKRVVLTIGCVFAIYAVVITGINTIFDVEDGPMKEMFCVPMQQLARAYNEAEEAFTEKDIEIMYSLVPKVILEKYNPKLADEVKVNFLEDNFKNDPIKYISLWARIGVKRPDIYINSFLVNTYGYWYPDTIIDGYRGKWNGDKTYEDSSYFSFITEGPGTRESKIPFLEKFYEKISLQIYQQKIPVISMLFSVGFWHWVYVFAVAYLLIRNYKKQAFAFLYIGLVYLTVLLGPIALVRYMLALFFCVPLILAVIFDAKAFAGNGVIRGL